MTSRERIRAVINGQMPDRVPLGLGGCETAGMHLLAYNRLNEILGVRSKPRLNTFMMNAVFEKETLNKMEGDINILMSMIDFYYI